MCPFTRQLARASMLATLALGLPRVMQGQRLVPGDTLRIAGYHQKVEGLLLSHDSATFVIRRVDGWDTLRFHSTDIIRAEVLRGHHRAGVKTIGKGALIGFGVGTALGLFARRYVHGGHVDIAELQSIVIFTSAVAGTTAGTIVGTVASFRRIDHWVPFDPRSPSESLLQR